MKTRHSVRNVRTNLEDTKAFTITSNSKSFRILSDNLYSDKIKAIIRELSCNAYDAHVSAGKADEPFYVALPTYNEPTFTIRDYGVGMDHDFVLELYTTYFGSDKSDSNDFVGVLGLGSKSPFSYTDSFVVTSFKNNMKRCYTCFINEDGIPSISTLSEEETNEPAGVEIKFAVDRNDMDAFSNRAAEVFKHFEVHPTVEGPYSASSKNFKFSGKGWRFHDISHGSYNNQQLAIMGNVAYPISDIQMSGQNNFKFSNFKEKFIFSNSFEIDFEIGELDVTPSRESLSYDEATVAAIRHKVAKVYDEIVEQMADSIKECETLWQAKTKFGKMTIGISHTDDLRAFFKGTHVNTEPIGIKEGSYDHEVVVYSGGNYSSQINRQSLNAWDWTWRETHNVRLGSIFILNDQKRKGVSKARALADDQSHSVYLLDKNEKTFLKALGDPPTQLASSISNEFIDGPSARSSKRYYFPFLRSSWRGWDIQTSFSDARGYEEVEDEKIRYIIRHRKNEYTFEDNSKVYSGRSMENILNCAVKAGILKEETKIYAVHKYEIKKKRFQKNKNFRPLGAYLKRKTRALLRKENIHLSIVARKRNDRLFNEITHSDRALLENDQVAEAVQRDSEYHRLRDLFYGQKIKHTEVDMDLNLSNMIELATNLGISAYNEDEVKIPYIRPLADFYPMLRFVRYTGWKNEEGVIAEYMNTVERSKS